MEYFVFRNNTVERFFPKEYAFSGYDDYGYGYPEPGNMLSVYISSLEKWCAITFERGYYNSYFGETDHTNYSNPLHNGGNLYLNNESVTELIIPNNITKA